MSRSPRGLMRRRRKGLLALAALGVAAVSLVLGLAASAQSFDEQTLVPSMLVERAGHTATLLPDGRVLVVGGNSTLTTSEIYNPTLNTWTPSGNLSTVRLGHTATLLPNGQVLVLGGSTYPVAAHAELYDIATGRWRLDGEPRISRSGNTATLLKDGNVLVAGGDSGYSTTTAELYAPATGQWTDTGNMSAVRYRHTATLLPDGRVLVAGGSGTPYVGGLYPITRAEVYDPATGEWSSAGTMTDRHERHTATLLLDGRVLVVGNFSYGDVPYPFPFTSPLLPGTEVYSPTANTWAPGAPLAIPRISHTATLLPDGRVVVIGGYSWYGRALSSVEIFDPASNRWYAARPLAAPHANHTATLLTDGTILVAGGDGPAGPTSTAERYDPRDAQLGIQHYVAAIMRRLEPPIFPPTVPPFFATPPAATAAPFATPTPFVATPTP